MNPSIQGFNCTKCTGCEHSIVQVCVKEFVEPDYIIPAERLTERQKNSTYWIVCLALNRTVELGQIGECELYQDLQDEPGAEDSSRGTPADSLGTLDFSKFMVFSQKG